eukprot:4083953-Alexandrium_andersonii.AAC.1
MSASLVGSEMCIRDRPRAQEGCKTESPSIQRAIKPPLGWLLTRLRFRAGSSLEGHSDFNTRTR